MILLIYKEGKAMSDWGKVMRGLECCQSDNGCTPCALRDCPYRERSDTDCCTRLHRDVLALLEKQEVRHGWWINAYPKKEQNPMFNYGTCSICGFEQSISNKLNFCPNCGAKMDKEEDYD